MTNRNVSNDVDKLISVFMLLILSVACICCGPQTKICDVEVEIPVSPLLALNETNEAAVISVAKDSSFTDDVTIESVAFELSSGSGLQDVVSAELLDKTASAAFAASVGSVGSDGSVVDNAAQNGTVATKQINLKKGCTGHKVELVLETPVVIASADTVRFAISLRLKDSIDMSNKITFKPLYVATDRGKVAFDDNIKQELRVGVALRRKMQDGIAARIPGLATTKAGTLLAIYDGRVGRYRDLQGDMDICVNRSTDGGATWSSMTKAIDMGEWGGLPQRYNGVSDGAILVDENRGNIFIVSLWMHGVLDPQTGKWVEGLTDTSTVWNHQWRSRGSQPGYGVKQSSQFLLVKSTDDGLSWSQPVNITRQVKSESWWLMAPGPGRGITLDDGTLVFPAEGRLEDGLQVSTIVYSKDGGETWRAGSPAYTNTNECMAVQLDDGSIMLNMRERSNRNRSENNGRAIMVTKDTAATWTEHPTSRNALIESACQASLYKHIYTGADGEKRSILFFFNPSSISNRDNFTLKCSLDNGETWPKEYWLLLDEQEGNGYSCITSIDNETIGILYEGSGADMVFQQVKIKDVIKDL